MWPGKQSMKSRYMTFLKIVWHIIKCQKFMKRLTFYREIQPERYRSIFYEERKKIMLKTKGTHFPEHPPVVEGNPSYHARRTSFYEGDETLQHIIDAYLPEEFAAYAKKELTDFGDRCANEIDERARLTDREGEPQLKKYDAYGDDIPEVLVNAGYLATVEETYHTGIVGYVHKTIPEL